MKSSTRGAARVNAIWLIVLLVLFFVALFFGYSANDEAVKAEQRAEAAETRATNAEQKESDMATKLRNLSELIGFYDRSDISSTTDLAVAKAGLEDFKTAIGTDADGTITTFEQAWPLAVTQKSGLANALETAKNESKTRAAEISTVRSSASNVASEKDQEISALRKELADLQETTTEEINNLEGQVARLTTERNEFDQEAVDSRDSLAKLREQQALQLSEYEARMNQTLAMTQFTREVGTIDGKIVGVSSKLNLAYINRGVKHRMVRGMVFEVVDADPTKRTVKGEIEVIRVMDSISEVAIRSVTDSYNAIALGDGITNPMYDAEGERNAVLVGRFDGKYNRQEVALLLKEVGINVQKDLDRSTMYMIMGNPLYKDPETGEALEEPLPVKDMPIFAQAQSWGVQMVSIAEMRHFFRR